MFDRGIEPGISVKNIITSSQVSGASHRVVICGIQFISCQHFHDHSIIAFILIEGTDYPVAPMPEVFLTVA